jgi:GNAT superfamily N-acetyltransferase
MNVKSTEINLLEWDSDFFNKRIGSLNIYNNINISNVNEFDLIYVKSSEELEVTIYNYFKTFEQTKVMFSKQLGEEVALLEKAISSMISSPDLKSRLYDLAFESGKFSRFLLDSNFEEDKFKSLYIKWVDNSFLEGYADDVLVYKENDKVLGFVTYKMLEKHAIIGLIAVDSDSQGKGIGSKLIEAVEHNLYINNIFELRIPTQLENKQACNFYTKLGYEVIEKEYIKHFWNHDTIQQTTPYR